jgi:hypothetical protein
MEAKKEKKKEPKKAKLDDEWEGDDEEREDEPLFDEGAPDADLPAFLAGGALRAKQVWSRPAVSEDLASCRVPLVFQTMEVSVLVFLLVSTTFCRWTTRMERRCRGCLATR